MTKTRSDMVRRTAGGERVRPVKKNATKTGAKSERASPDAEKQLQRFIDKFEPKTQALIRAARKALRKRLPTANELAYDNYNFFALGYCSTESVRRIASYPLLRRRTGWGCRSIGERRYPIRTGSCRGREIKIVSF